MVIRQIVLEPIRLKNYLSKTRVSAMAPFNYSSMIVIKAIAFILYLSFMIFSIIQTLYDNWWFMLVAIVLVIFHNKISDWIFGE